MPVLLAFPLSCPAHGDLAFSRGKAQYTPCPGQCVAVTVNSKLFSAFVALGRVSSAIHCFTRCNSENLPPLLKLLGIGEEAGGPGWRMAESKAEKGGGCSKLLVFHLQQPFSLMQVCALPITTAVIQLDKGVNSNWFILTRCSISETGYLTNECQMLSPNLGIVLLLHGKCYDFEVRV